MSNASSQGSPAPPQDETNSLKMIATLGGVSLLSGLLIVLTVSVTEARIQVNKDKALQKAVRAVLPNLGKDPVTFERSQDGFSPNPNPAQGSDRIYAGYDAEGKLVGVAFEAVGKGYGGELRGLFGYSPQKDAIIGFTVLASLETPGLGDRVDKDPSFLGNFDALDMTLSSTGDGLANPVIFVKHGEKSNPWEVEGISGATISSKAVSSMLSERGSDIVPFIKKHLTTLEGGAR